MDHVLDVVLRHWDISMRELGSQSLRLICFHDLDGLAPRVVEKSVRMHFIFYPGFSVFQYRLIIVGPTSGVRRFERCTWRVSSLERNFSRVQGTRR